MRTICAILISALTLVLGSAACAQDTGDARQAIEKGAAKWVEDFNKGDAAAIAAIYAEDAKVFPPGGEVVTDRPAIQKFWQGFIDSGAAKEVKLNTADIEQHADMAIEIGTYSIIGQDGKEADRGKYSVVWKRMQGGWKLYRDIWNSSMPPVPSK